MVSATSTSAARCRRALHKHTTRPARKRTARTRTARARTAGARNPSMGSASAHNASMHSKRMHSRYTQREHGGHKHDNASMHSASTKHGPVHPRDVDDVDERMSHDLSERCTSAPHAQHEGAQLEHTPHGHAQQAWARARTCRRHCTSTPCTQYGHTSVPSSKCTTAESAAPRPCPRPPAVSRRRPGAAAWRRPPRNAPGSGPVHP